MKKFSEENAEALLSRKKAARRKREELEKAVDASRSEKKKEKKHRKSLRASLSDLKVNLEKSEKLPRIEEETVAQEAAVSLLIIACKLVFGYP